MDWWNRVIVPRLARQRVEQTEQEDDAGARPTPYDEVEDSEGGCLPVVGLEVEQEEEGASSLAESDDDDRPHDG
ncbi:MAG: hypothetical protein ABI589_14635 [Burkholderiales bacterium]